MISDADRATSYRVLIQRLFTGGLLPYRAAMQYTDQEILAALTEALLPIVGADGLWAAREVLCVRRDGEGREA